MKSAIKSVLLGFGMEVHRARPASTPPQPGSPERPIGNIRSFLEDVKARGFTPRGILDVGANHGNWTRLALTVFPATPIVMIEPQDEMEAVLTQLSREIGNCRYVKAGAGKEEGELIQTIWPDLAGSSFLPEIQEDKVRAGVQRKTKIVTLDSVVAAGPGEFSPDLVKLDVQGFELEALRGGSQLFGRTELFVLETSLFPFFKGMPISSDVIAFMSERGYEMYDITERLRRPHDGALGQVDFAFVKRDGVFRKVTTW